MIISFRIMQKYHFICFYRSLSTEIVKTIYHMKRKGCLVVVWSSFSACYNYSFVSTLQLSIQRVRWTNLRQKDRQTYRKREGQTGIRTGGWTHRRSDEMLKGEQTDRQNSRAKIRGQEYRRMYDYLNSLINLTDCAWSVRRVMWKTFVWLFMATGK